MKAKQATGYSNLAKMSLWVIRGSVSKAGQTIAMTRDKPTLRSSNGKFLEICAYSMENLCMHRKRSEEFTHSL